MEDAKVTLSSSRFPTQLGAEARVEPTTWQGELAVRKLRVSKAYRDAALDSRLRARRTREEAELMHRAKLVGVSCPQILFADESRCELIMSFAEGLHLRDLQRQWGRKELSVVHEAVGASVGKLHAASIIHGDLTSRNIIVPQGAIDSPTFIDFGLSFISPRLEDRAEDLHLLRQAFLTTFESIRDSSVAFDGVLLGYRKIVGLAQCRLVEAQVAQIVRRGRYARVD